MGLKGSDKRRERSLIDLGWEVHELDDPDEGFRPKHVSFYNFGNFHLQHCLPSTCTLLGGEVVPEHLIRHGKEYRIPPISQLHCPTLASVIILLAGSPRVSFCVISLAITALL